MLTETSKQKQTKLQRSGTAILYPEAGDDIRPASPTPTAI